jgi:hypothetical protein
MTCGIPELPAAGCLVPESPPASPSPTPSASVAPSPPLSPTPEATVSPAAAPLVAPAPALPEAVAVTTVPQPPAVVPVLPVASIGSPTPPPLASSVPLSGVVPSAYAIVVFGLIGCALLVSFLSGLKPSGEIMKTTRTRLWNGLAVIAAAAVVGGIGWYRVSGEPLLNRQIPFLASAGIAVVVLAVLGGSLIVANQLRADQNRIGELEDAVRTLADALAPVLESPARLSKAKPRTRRRPAAIATELEDGVM